MRSIRARKQPSGLFSANREEALADEVKRAQRDSESPLLRQSLIYAVLTNGVFLLSRPDTARAPGTSSYPLCMARRVPKYAWPCGGAICRAGRTLADFRCERSISSYFSVSNDYLGVRFRHTGQAHTC